MINNLKDKVKNMFTTKEVLCPILYPDLPEVYKELVTHLTNDDYTVSEDKKALFFGENSIAIYKKHEDKVATVLNPTANPSNFDYNQLYLHNQILMDFIHVRLSSLISFS